MSFFMKDYMEKDDNDLRVKIDKDPEATDDEYKQKSKRSIQKKT